MRQVAQVFHAYPLKLSKYSCNAFVSFLTTLFNHCIDIGKLSAIVTPLNKNKGIIVDFNNYRGISVLSSDRKNFWKIIGRSKNDLFKIKYYLICWPTWFKKWSFVCNCLTWIADRFQGIKFNRKLSSPMSIKLGVPQGKCLGPTIFHSWW